MGVLIPQASAEAPNKIVDTRSPQEMAIAIATEHNLNVEQFLGTIKCESGWNVDAVGDHGTSFGLAQLHYPPRWGIATSSAYDPAIALEVMAHAWVRGEQNHWTCWQLLYR